MGAESGNIVTGAFTPVLAKHSKSFSLIDCISVGVDRMQRSFEPMQKQVELICTSDPYAREAGSNGRSVADAKGA